MPPEINLPERLQAIAKASLELAREKGPRGVTVRAVADQLGGSTTLITKYLPSRIDLLKNAFDYVSMNWVASLTETLDGREGMDKLRALAEWSLQTQNYDDAIRGLWLDAITGNPPKSDQGETVQTQARAEYGFIKETVAEAGHEEWVADALFLAFRGYYVSSIEDPEAWPAERASAAVGHLLDLIDAQATDISGS